MTTHMKKPDNTEHSHTSQGPSPQADLIHQLAFHSILQLPQHDEVIATRKPAPLPAQVEAILATLTPEQRERTFNIAMRRLALQLLYEADLSDAQTESSFEAVLSKLAFVDGLGPFQAQKTRDLCTGAWQARAASDAEFAKIAPEWPTYRLAAIDRALLRLGRSEGTSAITPARIVIHECVELARAFGTEKSAAFINALLDKALQSQLQSESAMTR